MKIFIKVFLITLIIPFWISLVPIKETDAVTIVVLIQTLFISLTTIAIAFNLSKDTKLISYLLFVTGFICFLNGNVAWMYTIGLSYIVGSFILLKIINLNNLTMNTKELETVK